MIYILGTALTLLVGLANAHNEPLRYLKVFSDTNCEQEITSLSTGTNVQHTGESIFLGVSFMDKYFAGTDIYAGDEYSLITSATEERNPISGVSRIRKSLLFYQGNFDEEGVRSDVMIPFPSTEDTCLPIRNEDGARFTVYTTGREFVGRAYLLANGAQPVANKAVAPKNVSASERMGIQKKNRLYTVEFFTSRDCSGESRGTFNTGEGQVFTGAEFLQLGVRYLNRYIAGTFFEPNSIYGLGSTERDGKEALVFWQGDANRDHVRSFVEIHLGMRGCTELGSVTGFFGAGPARQWTARSYRITSNN